MKLVLCFLYLVLIALLRAAISNGKAEAYIGNTNVYLVLGNTTNYWPIEINLHIDKFSKNEEDAVEELNNKYEFSPPAMAMDEDAESGCSGNEEEIMNDNEFFDLEATVIYE